MKSKLPKARKLPSGRWNVIVTVKGERISITEDTEKLAQAKAVSVKAGLLNTGKKPQKLPLSDAIDRYIDSKSEILSPSTILHYRSMQRLRFQSIMQMDVNKLTKQDIQRAVNDEAKLVSPKTVYNAYGLIRPVLKDNGIDVFGVRLPRRKTPEISTIEQEEISRLFSAIKGDKYEPEILLALWLGLRRSEILGLCWDAIDWERSTIAVKRAYTQDSDGGMILRDDTKTIKSRRTVACPAYLMGLLDEIKKSRVDPKPTDRIFRHSENVMTRRLHKICEEHGISDTTLHGLRHTNAAVMRFLGVSDAHAMERGGWTSEGTYKGRYSYVFERAADQDDERIEEYFTSNIQQKIQR